MGVKWEAGLGAVRKRKEEGFGKEGVLGLGLSGSSGLGRSLGWQGAQEREARLSTLSTGAAGLGRHLLPGVPQLAQALVLEYSASGGGEEPGMGRI